MPLDMAGASPDDLAALRQSITDQQNTINSLQTALNQTAAKTTVDGLTTSVGGINSSLSSANNKISALEGLVSTLQGQAANAVKLATVIAPVAEGMAAAIGSGSTAARDDHVHKRLSSAGLNTNTTNASGIATVVFDQAFVDIPGVVFTAIENNTNPIPRFKIMTWTRDANNLIIGCTVYCERNRPLPVLDPVSGLLTAVITGVNVLVTALTGYKPYEIGASIQFTFVAIKSSKGS